MYLPICSICTYHVANSMVAYVPCIDLMYVEKSMCIKHKANNKYF